eukprot:1323023-Pleurochrysis_carterae.AAC.1
MLCRKYAMAGKFAANAKAVVQAAELRMRRDAKAKVGGRSVCESTASAGAQQTQAVEVGCMAQMK